MENSKIIDRIRKLLALATSSNVNEAASAASTAQDLMFSHKLEMADLNVGNTDTDEPVGDHVMDENGKGATWKGIVANGLARSNTCKAYWQNRKLKLIGRQSDVQTVTYIYQYLVLEIERLATTFWKAEKANNPYVSAQSWKNSFRVGAATAVSQRLREERIVRREVAMVNNSTALAIVDRGQDAIRAYVKQNLNLCRVGRAAVRSKTGFEVGQAAGQGIALGGGAKALGGSKARLSG